MLGNLCKAIDGAQRIALIMHVSPDGDTCGTAFALRRALTILGKDVSIFCDDPVPENCQNLEGAECVQKPSIAVEMLFDLAIAVDVGDWERMGECAFVFHAAKETAQIDHHGTNTEYAGINYVDSPLSATAVLAAHLINAFSIPFDPIIAECLYVAVASDTGNFRYHNTDTHALRLAARCLEQGVDPQAVASRLFDIKPYAQMLLIAKAIESMRLLEAGAIAIMQLTKEDFLQTGALPEHTEGIVNFARNTQGVLMACLLVEQEEQVRCNLRSLFPFDVSIVATRFGGGGHAQAAGCTLQNVPLSEARRMITEALLEEWSMRKTRD